MVPVQALGELFRVLVGKGGFSRDVARASLMTWRDAVILAVAADAGCLLLSEDMQDGFTWRGLTVANPVRRRTTPLLAAIWRCQGRVSAQSSGGGTRTKLPTCALARNARWASSIRSSGKVPASKGRICPCSM